VNINHLLHQYGYAAVFVLVAGESLGIPLPGETILIAAGIYAGSSHRLSVWGIFGVAAAGAVIGDNIGFFIGDKGGYPLLRKYGHYIRFDATKIKIGRYIFDRHGAKVVFFGRFVSVLRTYAAFLAGTTQMRWPRFLVWNATGGVIWAAIYSFVPYEAGNSVKNLSSRVGIALGVAAVVVIVAGFFYLRRQAGKFAERAEAAYPGPLPDS
jgi:membrane protein DedA with SNARE-associated domain